ncbi:MAG: hypothetical protein L6413_05945 [Coriobacteriia bacterium]|nr:hypothetical protein [Coriobacteriia bacterium]
MVKVTARKALFVAVSSLMLALAFATPAFAGWLDWSVAATMPANLGATSPHGGYTTSTVKCAVCHSVHNADVLGSEILLPAPASEACTYCHVGGAGGYTQVYRGVEANYSGTNYSNAHNSFSIAGVEQGVTCSRCHQVHAAANQMTVNPYLTQRLLKKFTVYDWTAGAPLVGDAKDTAMTKWCAGCHFSLTPPLGGEHYADDYNFGSHIQGTANASYANPVATYTGRVAWKDSTQCMSCHASQYGEAGEWPHMTDGVRFLVEASSSVAATAPASASNSDGVCLRCHRDNAGNGVGEGY